MRRNKPGLSDLKKLRQQTEARGPGTDPARHDTPPAGLPPAASGRPAMPAGRRPAAGAVDSAALLDEDDRRLFRNAVRHVEKLKDPGRVLLAPVAPAPPSMLQERRRRAAGLEDRRSRRPSPAGEPERAGKSRPGPRPLSDAYAPAGNDHDDSRHLKPGHGTDVLKGLKRGRWPIGASLDLHGSTLEDARERFDRFLGSCLEHEVKCVRIVHGKGYGSRDGDAVLKTAVRRWLAQIAEVIAYTECADAEGGSGAVQVLLK